MDKKDALSENEYEEIKSYPHYNKKILANIMGFNDIALWSSKIQELLNESGYPYNLSGKDMSLKDRLLATVNIYTSLTQKKSFRNAYSKSEALDILRDMVKKKKIDASIVNDIKTVLVK